MIPVLIGLSFLPQTLEPNARKPSNLEIRLLRALKSTEMVKLRPHIASPVCFHSVWESTAEGNKKPFENRFSREQIQGLRIFEVSSASIGKDANAKTTRSVLARFSGYVDLRPARDSGEPGTFHLKSKHEDILARLVGGKVSFVCHIKRTSRSTLKLERVIVSGIDNDFEEFWQNK